MPSSRRCRHVLRSTGNYTCQSSRRGSRFALHSTCSELSLGPPQKWSAAQIALAIIGANTRSGLHGMKSTRSKVNSCNAGEGAVGAQKTAGQLGETTTRYRRQRSGRLTAAADDAVAFFLELLFASAGKPSRTNALHVLTTMVHAKTDCKPMCVARNRHQPQLQQRSQCGHVLAPFMHVIMRIACFCLRACESITE